MNQASIRPMIAADILKLRRHRATMTTAALLSVGMAIVYFTFIEARHHGNLAGPQVLSDGATMMGTYFGAFAAILASFLGPLRDLVLLMALGGLFPGQQTGTRAHPGSSIALNNFKLPMPVAAAVLVILAWALIPAALGAWRTSTQDA